ncbi:MAG: hypothetical protein ABIL50_05135 [candidate division WOR-3 bacterium]
MKTAFILISFLTALAQLLKVRELGYQSIRGRLYLSIFVIFIFQGLYGIFQKDWLLLISRLIVAIGVLQYAIPFIRPSLRDFGIKWIAWFALSLIVLVPVVAIWFYIVGVYFNLLAFWGSEVGKRWIPGSIIITLTFFGDLLLSFNQNYGYTTLIVMSALMTLVALRRG